MVANYLWRLHSRLPRHLRYASGCAASVPLPTRHLRLLFRLVIAMPSRSLLRSAQDATYLAPPSHRGLINARRLVCDAKPHASCVGSPCPGTRTRMHSLLCGRRPTAMLTPSSLRLRARAGRLTLKQQAVIETACRSTSCTTPAVCSNPVVDTPCSLRYIGCLTSATHSIRITAHRHITPLDLIGVSASRESGAVVCVPIRKRNFHAHGSDFTAHRGRLCI